MYEGDFSLWDDLFPDSLVPQLIELICEAWQSIKLDKSDRLEVPITRKLYARLQLLKSLRDQGPDRLPFRISWETPLVDPLTSVVKGRIDIRFSHGHCEEVYFAVECKRLNVVSRTRVSSLAGDYVEDGMMRFITGQYAEGLDKGGMLAYVMDGQIGPAVESIRRAIEARRRPFHGRGRGVGGIHNRPFDAYRERVQT